MKKYNLFEEYSNDILHIYNQNTHLFSSLEDTYIFFEWFISIKEIIINKVGNNKLILSEYFGRKEGYVGEGFYNIAFNYQNKFIIKIPKIDIFYIEDIQNIYNETEYSENAYGLFGEYDIIEGNYELYKIDYNISKFVIDNLLVLPQYVNLHLCFGIYDIGKEIEIRDNKLLGKENNNLLKYVNNYNIFHNLLLNKDKYEEIIEQLDYKIEHVLLVGNTIKYCDVDTNVLQGFCEYVQKEGYVSN